MVHGRHAQRNHARLSACCCGMVGAAASPVLHTLDHVETQLFALDPPVDATAIRIVSLTNAERAQRDAAGDGAAPRQEAFPHLLSGLSAYVGLFQVAFA